MTLQGSAGFPDQNTCPLLADEDDYAELFPRVFDGPDTQLKKMMLLSAALRHTPSESVGPCFPVSVQCDLATVKLCTKVILSHAFRTSIFRRGQFFADSVPWSSAQISQSWNGGENFGITAKGIVLFQRREHECRDSKSNNQV